MKKVLCMLFAAILNLSSVAAAYASEATVSVDNVAVDLLNDALSQPDVFSLPDLCEKAVYLCNPIHPYVLNENTLEPCDDIEYYIVKTDVEFVACITLCYVDSKLMSASLNIGIADTLNASCDLDEAFQLVVQDGVLYVKTADNQAVAKSTGADDTASVITSIEGTLETLSIKSKLSGIVTNPVVVRSSKILSVPYVPQGDTGLCWAAAGASFGQYYTGNKYAHYTAAYLAEEMGIGVNEGASIETTAEMLRRYFYVNTVVIEDRLSDHEAITLFQQGKPILAAFHGTNLTSGASVGHMVVLCGYNDGGDGSQITYYIRDPNYESMVSVIAYDSDALIMEYLSGRVLFWDESAYYTYTP